MGHFPLCERGADVQSARIGLLAACRAPAACSSLLSRLLVVKCEEPIRSELSDLLPRVLMRASVRCEYCSANRGLQSPSARIVFSLQVSKDLNREELSEAGVGKSVGCQLVEEPVEDETIFYFSPRTLFHHAKMKN